ncbi:hypothetical protein BdWA1_000159 [Babesia duncani]|uniref:Uncharacterized protein n=1 Tax=Babesia duncani TaxID=323732 RepID=A0AAD9PM18_9APIC|nr:hypothetical protein BdWA1_000159 [Babesia duncani]
MERKLNMKRVEVLHINNGIKLFKLDNPWYEEKYGDQRSKYIYHKIDNDRCGTISGGQFIYEWVTYTLKCVEFDVSEKNVYIKETKPYESTTLYSLLYSGYLIISVSEGDVYFWEFDQMNGHTFLEAYKHEDFCCRLSITLMTLNGTKEYKYFYKLNDVWYRKESNGESTQIPIGRNTLLNIPLTDSSFSNFLRPLYLTNSELASNVGNQYQSYQILLDTSVRGSVIGYRIENYKEIGNSITNFITEKGYVFNKIIIGNRVLNLDSMVGVFIVIMTEANGVHVLHIGSYENAKTIFVECFWHAYHTQCNNIEDKIQPIYSFPLNVSEFPDERFYYTKLILLRGAVYKTAFIPNDYMAFDFVMSSVEGDVLFIKKPPCKPFWNFSVRPEDVCYQCSYGINRMTCVDKF